MVTAYAAYGDRNIKEERSCRADHYLNDISEIFRVLDYENTEQP